VNPRDLYRQTLIAIDRVECRESLHTFVERAWHIIEPGVTYVDGPHIRAICEHLQAITDGQIRFLLINIPPRHAKSTIVSVMWPCWEWIRRPQEKYLSASYSGILSTRDNLKARRLITSPWYQARWGDVVELTGDQNQKTRFENTSTGYRIASSVGGTATGEGGSRLICLHPDTLIQCRDGLRPISDVVESRMQVEVLGYDHDVNQPAWRPINRFERSAGRRMVRIRTAQREVVVTHDHPVFVVGAGYLDAERVKPGDCLLSYLPSAGKSEAIVHRSREDGDVQQSVRCGGLATVSDYRHVSSVRGSISSATCASGASGAGNLLQSQVPCGGSDRGCKQGMEGWARRESLPHLSESQAAQAKPDSLLFRLVRFAKAAGQQAMRYLQGNDHGIASTDAERQDVFAVMRSDAAQPSCGWRGEWAVCAWGSVGTVPQRLSGGGGGCQETRCSVSLVRQDACGTWDGVACPPHQLRQGQQRFGQPDRSVPQVSWQHARLAAITGELAADPVLAVEPAEQPQYVYNVAVSGTHNYFASGLLLHNCDDPHSAQDAQSDKMRESALEWFDMVWSTRLNDPKRDAMVTIMQRLHEQDVSGRILELGDWEHLCLPAEWDGVRRKTKLGHYDKRTTEGELLWPERFGAKELDKLKAVLGDYGVAGQLQQAPAPAGGGILKPDRFRLWPNHKALPPMEYILQSYDTAFTANTHNDPTACSVWGLFFWEGCYNVMLIDAWHDHLEYPDLRARVIKEWTAKYAGDASDPTNKARSPDLCLIEKKGSGQSLLQDLGQARILVAEYNPGNADKISRAHMITPLLDAGLVWVPESKRGDTWPTWADAMMTQLSRFPNAEHDDYCDSATQALRYIRDLGYLTLARSSRYDDLDRPPANPVINPYAQ
jgi:predicted phage terminase large subunit-like protein